MNPLSFNAFCAKDSSEGQAGDTGPDRHLKSMIALAAKVEGYTVVVVAEAPSNAQPDQRVESFIDLTRPPSIEQVDARKLWTGTAQRLAWYGDVLVQGRS